MFGFLKDKLKSAISVFSKKVKEEVEEVAEKPAEKKLEKEAKKPEVSEKPVKKEEKPEGKKESKTSGKEPVTKQEIPVKKEIKPVREEKKEAPKKNERVIEKPVVKEPEKEIIEQKPEVKEAAIEKEEEPKKQGFFGKLFRKKEEPEEEKKPEEPEPVVEKTEEKQVIEEPEEKKGIFAKVKEHFTKFNLSDEKFEQIFWELEVVLLENNVAVEVIEKIKDDMKKELTSNKIFRKGVDDVIQDTLRKSIEELFDIKEIDLLKEVKKKKPYVICMIGVNGSGKTTTMAKLANLLLKNKMSVVFAAADTFRAAAIQQLEEHANNLGIKIIKQDYKSDPAAVAFDAIQHAKAKGIDVVLIDTAGRQHSNDNLMNELKKLVRVNKPDMKIFVGESITGNDCIEQAKTFDEAVGIDAIILAKADVDEKGGAAISVSYVTKKPILYIGVGQDYDSLKKFEPKIVVESLGL